jgi:peptide deformylase
MKLEIKYWPDACLRKVAKEVETDDPELGLLVAALFDKMYESKGMGLAATQCNVQKRVLVMDGTLAGGKERRAFINPVIKEKTEKTIITEEGCLSFPGVYAKVKRADGVIVECDTEDGEKEDVMLTGVDAVILQHELDHLNGIVFYDHLGPAKKRMLDEKVRKVVKKISRRKK